MFDRLISLLSTRIPLALTALFHRAGWVKQYQPLPHLSIAVNDQSDRIKGRLDAICDNISADARVGVDIGCNNGFYVFSLAETGRLMYGIEGSDTIFQVFLAAKRKFPGGNVIPVNVHVTPDNVQLLPTSDFVICMSVFHHWARMHGGMIALDMLSQILANTRQTLFFEVPFARDSGKAYRDKLPDRNVEDPEAWWIDWFKKQGWESFAPIFQRTRTLYRIERAARS